MNLGEPPGNHISGIQEALPPLCLRARRAGSTYIVNAGNGLPAIYGRHEPSGAVSGFFEIRPDWTFPDQSAPCHAGHVRAERLPFQSRAGRGSTEVEPLGLSGGVMPPSLSRLLQIAAALAPRLPVPAPAALSATESLRRPGPAVNPCRAFLRNPPAYRDVWERHDLSGCCSAFVLFACPCGEKAGKDASASLKAGDVQALRHARHRSHICRAGAPVGMCRIH